MSAGSLIDLYPNRGLRLVRGDGTWLEAADGRRYLDLMTNYGVNLFGYGHPGIHEALAAQLAALPTLHGSFTSDVRVRASLELARRMPMTSPAICWSNSGAEAVEAALKFAVMATGKRHFVTFSHGYHGKTLGALSSTDSAKYRAPFEPLLWDFARVPFGDADAARRAITDRTAGVLVEPIQGEGGVRLPPTGFLAALRRIATDAGVLLMVDEIQTGCGRTGRFLASDHDAVAPDIVCLGKGLAGGIPVGATIVAPAVAAAIPRGLHTSTFGGNPLACAGTLAVLGLLTDDRLARVSEAGSRFRWRLSSVWPHEVRGAGLMVGLVAGRERDVVLKDLQRSGILAIPAGDDVVRFLPPLTIGDAELDLAIDACARIGRP